MKTKQKEKKPNTGKVTQHFKVEDKETTYTIEFERKTKK